MMQFLDQENGFTIVEAFIAQVILIIVALATWSVFVAGSRFNAESEDRTVAASVAQLKMEEMMNTPFRYIVEQHPAGETRFDSLPQAKPYWIPNSEDQWIPSLPEGRYTIGYPDGVDADPLRIIITISWENHVSRPEVQKFAGALQGKRAKKGIFITTSAFTREAQQFVSNIDSKIILIDGERLAELMIEHNVAVSTTTSYEVKKIDTDYFDE